MENKIRCTNLNHNRLVVTIKYCCDCGEKVGPGTNQRCDEAKHAKRRKDRNTYCCDCGKSIR